MRNEETLSWGICSRLLADFASPSLLVYKPSCKYVILSLRGWQAILECCLWRSLIKPGKAGLRDPITTRDGSHHLLKTNVGEVLTS